MKNNDTSPSTDARTAMVDRHPSPRQRGEGEIKISETDPGQAPLAPAAVDLTAGLNFTLNIKNTRAAVIEAVKNSRNIPLVHQETILAEIAAMDDKHALMQLTVI